LGVDLRLLPGVHGASIDVVRFYTGACRMPEGRSTGEYIEGITSGIRREPVGVWGQITPWNYPFMMAVWKWAPAVAAGNTVVLKPSELTPSSTFRMAELLTDVLPAGVVNVVCGGPVCPGAAARGGRARHNGRAADLNGAADWISGRCR
jgi:acyl-CoA reductase-like NAD-dependent aldehyde dehydrogenase